MSCCGSRDAVAGERIQRLAQTALGIEARVRHRNAVHDECAASETFHLEPELLEIFPVCLEGIAFSRAEMERYREQQTLRRCTSRLQRSHELLVQHALMRRMLIDQNETVGVLERDVSPFELKERRNLPRRLHGCVCVVVLRLLRAREQRLGIDLCRREYRNTIDGGAGEIHTAAVHR